MVEKLGKRVRLNCDCWRSLYADVRESADRHRLDMSTRGASGYRRTDAKPERTR